MAKARLPARKRKGTVARALTVEYHVVPNGRRWDVERDDAFNSSFAYDVNTAIGLAIAGAQRGLHNGRDVMVRAGAERELPKSVAVRNVAMRSHNEDQGAKGITGAYGL